jgi:AcrR family transcriptional regulator
VGLRETKAEKTRKRILKEALQLFKRNGYEQTTMETIAEAAEVSPRTLYRYFLSKDLILLDPLTSGYNLSAAFSRHSVNRPVEEALAEALFDWAKWQDMNSEEILLVRSLVDQAPIPRARLWDLIHQQERDLSACLSERLHLPEDDLQVVLSVRLVLLTIIGTVADERRASAGKSSSVAIATRVIRMFEEHKVLFPRKAPCVPRDENKTPRVTREKITV